MLAIGVVAPENTADRTGKITTGGDLKGAVIDWFILL